jgi:hypothetical protein
MPSELHDLARRNPPRQGKDNMTISDITDPTAITGASVVGADGDKLGKVDAIYYDNETDKPEWAAVKSGLFGSHVTLVPLSRGNWDGDTLTVPFDKSALKTAPAPRPQRRHQRDRRGRAVPPLRLGRRAHRDRLGIGRSA